MLAKSPNPDAETSSVENEPKGHRSVRSGFAGGSNLGIAKFVPESGFDIISMQRYREAHQAVSFGRFFCFAFLVAFNPPTN
jgi:hypothetical protein